MSQLWRNMLLCLMFITVAVSSVAQSRTLPFLESHGDSRASAMGNQALMSTEGNFLYVNPTSIFNGNTRITAGLNTQILPLGDENSGREWYVNAQVGYRPHVDHAVYLGYRHQGGLKLSAVSVNGEDMGQFIEPRDLALDLGYAFRFHPKFSAFATAAFVESIVAERAYAGVFGLGFNYRDSVEIGSYVSPLNIAVAARDFGTNLRYGGQEKSYYLPTSLQLGIDWGVPFSDKHLLTLVAGGRCFILEREAQIYQIGVGVEYDIKDMIRAQLGYQYAQRQASVLTAGIGLHYAGFQLDLAYLHGLKADANYRFLFSLTYRY